MITLSFNEFAERYGTQLQAVFFFTQPEASTPRIPVGERTEILLAAWQLAADAVCDRLSAWTDDAAPADKANPRVRHLHLTPEAEERLARWRIDACLMALVRDACHPDAPPRAPGQLADLTADLL